MKNKSVTPSEMAKARVATPTNTAKSRGATSTNAARVSGAKPNAARDTVNARSAPKGGNVPTTMCVNGNNQYTFFFL